MRDFFGLENEDEIVEKEEENLDFPLQDFEFEEIWPDHPVES